ncbi:hypothetical protein EON65_48565 [archaeon]|nr:MAG: hypothetical protein EON65_48565 [archaeon]
MDTVSREEGTKHACLDMEEQESRQEEIEEEDEDEYFSKMAAHAQAQDLEDEDSDAQALMNTASIGNGDEDEYFNRVQRVNVELANFGIKPEDDPIWFQLDLQLQGYGNILVRK